MAQALLCFDVLSNYVLACKIDKMELGEKSFLRALLPEIKTANALFILDRGFGCFSICKMMGQQNHSYCIRLSNNISSFTNKAMLSAETDFIVQWQPSVREQQNCIEHGLDTVPIEVRVSKVLLDTGEVELLVSNLFDKETIDEATMKHLYFLRWGIEEGIKKLKPKMKLEHFGCKKMDGVYQEFYAHIFMLNLVAILGNQAQQGIEEKMNKCRHKYKYNWQNAYRYTRDKIVALANQWNIANILNELIEKIRMSVIAIIPNRAFSREKKSSNKSRLFQCYK
jgi:hypothetical protein